MANNENVQNFFLGIEKRPGDVKLIEVSKLRISNGFIPYTLAELDSFTMNFTQEEIMNSIKEVNIVDSEYFDGNLVIQDNQKHHPLPVIDKNYLEDFNLTEFLKENISNKNLMNNIAYKFSTIDGISEELILNFKNGVKLGDVNLIMDAIFKIDYFHQRKFMIYLIDLYKNEKKKKLNKNINLIRDKAA